jgi:hypothetical protein
MTAVAVDVNASVQLSSTTEAVKESSNTDGYVTESEIEPSESEDLESAPKRKRTGSSEGGAAVGINDENALPTDSHSQSITSDKKFTDDTCTGSVVQKKTAIAIISPLPTPRQLNQTMCKIVDQRMYGRNDALDALHQLVDWAKKDSIDYLHQLIDLGGLRQVMFFLEDLLDVVLNGVTATTDAECINTALDLLLVLTKPGQNDDSDILDMRFTLAKQVVDLGGVELILTEFDQHSISSTFLSAPEAVTTVSTEETKVEGNGSIWNSLKTMWNCDENTTCVLDDISNTACMGGRAVCEDDRMDPDHPNVEGSTNSQAKMADGNHDGTNPAIACATAGSVMTLGNETATRAMQLLTIVVSHASTAQARAVLQAICAFLPSLLAVSKASGGYGNEKYESLVASLMACMVAATSLMESSTDQYPQMVVGVTVNVMQDFPQHNGIHRICCMVLRQVCPQLSKRELKHLGVVAALGSVVASNTIDVDVKEIADAILEEQFAMSM